MGHKVTVLEDPDQDKTDDHHHTDPEVSGRERPGEPEKEPLLR